MLLIDGDVLAHMACPSRWKDQNGHTLVMYDKTQKVFSKDDEAKYLKVAYNTLHAMLGNLLDATWETEYLMGMKHTFNYRDAFFPGYKKNRYKDTNTFNNFVPVIRSLAVYEGLAIYSEGVEVDDCIGIWATECQENNIPFKIATIDKDLRTIPGIHYHLKDKVTEEVTPEEARRFYYKQLLMGDPVDNIPGLPGIGPQKAEKYLKSSTCEEEFQEVVISLYESFFKDEWYEYLMSNGKLLHILRKPGDYFSCKNWEYAKYLQNQRATPFYTPGAVDEFDRKDAPNAQAVETQTQSSSVLILPEERTNVPKIEVPKLSIPKIEKSEERLLADNHKVQTKVTEASNDLSVGKTVQVSNAVGIPSVASIKVSGLKVPTLKG